MKAFKGFNKDLRCRGHQFEIGKSYEEPEAKLCSRGFHACENPLDVLDYYALLDVDANNNRFAEVELDEVSPERRKDSKLVAKKIHIKAELSIKGLIKAGIDWLFEANEAANIHPNREQGPSASKERFSKLAASGDGSMLAASGDGSKLAASGYGSMLAASGDGSKLAASGDGSKLAASGDGSKLAASGDGSVVMNAGINGIAKAPKGCWITLAEWKNVDGKWTPVAVVTKQVDGNEIKADTWYKLDDGAFCEVAE